jgi:hypothetical protein
MTQMPSRRMRGEQPNMSDGLTREVEQFLYREARLLDNHCRLLWSNCGSDFQQSCGNDFLFQRDAFGAFCREQPREAPLQIDLNGNITNDNRCSSAVTSDSSRLIHSRSHKGALLKPPFRSKKATTPPEFPVPPEDLGLDTDGRSERQPCNANG